MKYQLDSKITPENFLENIIKNLINANTPEPRPTPKPPVYIWKSVGGKLSDKR